MDSTNILDRISSVKRSTVHDVDNDACSLDMSQEFVSESYTLCSAFDKTRHIRDDETSSVTEINNPQIGLNRCERIGGNLRFGVRHTGQEGRFSGIRKTYKADIRDQFKLHYDIQIQGSLSGFRILRCLIGRRGKVHISPAAASASEDGLSHIFA